MSFETNSGTDSTSAAPSTDGLLHPQEPGTAVNLSPSQTYNLDAEQINYILNTLSVVKSDMGILEDNYRKANEGIKSFKKRLNHTEKNSIVTKAQQTQTLAIFVGLFTFISIEFQLFKQTESIFIVPMSLGVGGLLIAFLAALTLIIQAKSSKHYWGLLISGVIVAAVGVILYYNAKSDMESNIPVMCQEIKTKIADSTIRDNQEEIDKYSLSYETLLCK